MAFVLDASVAACWVFDDESHPCADTAFSKIRTEEAVVPNLWWYEIRNILVVNERRNRIQASDTAAFLQDLSRLRIRFDAEPGQEAILRLARIHKLSVYDAAYLDLAQREGLALATLDELLARAAETEKVELIR